MVQREAELVNQKLESMKSSSLLDQVEEGMTIGSSSSSVSPSVSSGDRKPNPLISSLSFGDASDNAYMSPNSPLSKILSQQ